MSNATQEVLQRLLDHYGPQHWWPADSPVEVMIGAVLVQNTAWTNVQLAIDNLRDARLLDARRLLALDPTQLEKLIRPAGTFRRKAQRLRALLEFFVYRYNASISAMRATSTAVLRDQLLQVHGIGPETADAILLYALEQPVLVVDAYTQRVFARHGWVPQETGYERLQRHLQRELREEVSTYNELHALLVQVGKDYCRKTPQCEQCPLAPMLPRQGAICH